MPLLYAVVAVAGLLSAQQSVDAWVKALVPLLEDVRDDMGPSVTVAPGTLPPSPITGRSAALIAIRIGVNSIDVDEQVVQTIDRLLDAQRQSKPLSEGDRQLITRWVDELRVKLLGRLVARGKAADCDDLCLSGHLTKPDTLFEGTRRQREEERNYVLLETLAAAIQEPAAVPSR